MPCKLINADTVQELLTMKDTVDACEIAFRDWGNNEVICPTKVTLELGEDAEWPPYKNGLNGMPAYIHSMKSAGIKCVGGSLNNPSWGLPYIIALISLFDPETGVFRCVMDGEQITNYRTGAQAAVAANYMRDKKKIRLGIFGTGAQGRTQLMAFAEVFEIEEAIVYDISNEAVQKYIAEMAPKTNIKITAADSPEKVFAGTDIIVSVTHARNKFIKNDWFKAGQIIFPMGSFTECEDELLLSANRVFVDSIGQTLHRGALKNIVDTGKFNREMITATIGELVAGKVDGHIKEGEKIVCVPIGTGAMDVAVATKVYEKAKALGLGSSFVFNDDTEVEPKR